jgi:F-type H+-transporting ATPase subunit gamma
MEELDRIEARLDRIRAVEPVFRALRTISLGSWRAAGARRARLGRYRQRLASLFASLWPAVSARRPVGAQAGPVACRGMVLIVGSERGMCGGFNEAVLDRAEQLMAEQMAEGMEVETLVLGARMRRLMARRERAVTWSASLSLASLPPFDLAWGLARRALVQYAAGEIDWMDVITNVYQAPGRYTPTSTRVIPPRMPDGLPAREGHQGWPPPIIETDPQGLLTRVVEQWVALHTYELLLASAVAEHSTRHQITDGATRNVERLIDELTLAWQMARQKEITAEIQELAAGAGLVGPGP